MKKLIIFSLLSFTILSFSNPSDIRQITGKVTLLRVHEIGTKYGPSSDKIDVEAVVQLSTLPGKAFGFQLRNNTEAAVHEAMFGLLRDAFANNWDVTIEFEAPAGKSNGILLRVWVKK